MNHSRSAAVLLALLSLVGCDLRTPVGSNGSGGSGGSPSGSGVDANPGNGGSSGSGGSSGGGGAVALCSAAPEPAPNCPAGPSGDTACPQLHVVCDYQRDNGWYSCACVAGTQGNVWSCYGVGAGYDCPTTRPAHGSTCGNNDFGRSCLYVRPLACTCAADRETPWVRNVQCDCRRDSGSWSCANQGAAGASGTAEQVGKPFPEAPCYGTSSSALPRPQLDENKIVKDLSDAELQTFCNWYVELARGSGPPPPRNPPLGFDAQGNALGYGYTICRSPIGGCTPWVSADLCRQNVRREPCTATLRDLDDCLLTFHNSCQIVNQGCQALARAAGCSSTLVQLGSPDAAFGCSLPTR
jgi:hypothetical protein